MKRYIAVLAGLVLSPLVGAQDAQVPPALMYANKPIDSLCFSNQEGNKAEIQLARCGAAAEKMTVKGQNADLLKKGYIGYDWQAAKSAYPAQGYSYYRFFDAGNQQYWLHTVNNGGGSGDFTAVSRVSRKNDNTMLMQ
ncbi:MAG: hypothetical protein OJI67_07790, partial [Prosthecobacter sp.]|nr:hypothetical protein [Prosthecobacter sp.]